MSESNTLSQKNSAVLFHIKKCKFCQSHDNTFYCFDHFKFGKKRSSLLAVDAVMVKILNQNLIVKYVRQRIQNNILFF